MKHKDFKKQVDLNDGNGCFWLILIFIILSIIVGFTSCEQKTPLQKSDLYKHWDSFVIEAKSRGMNVAPAPLRIDYRAFHSDTIAASRGLQIWVSTKLTEDYQIEFAIYHEIFENWLGLEDNQKTKEGKDIMIMSKRISIYGYLSLDKRNNFRSSI